MLGTTTIAGRLTAAPTLRETPQGKAVTTLRAVTAGTSLTSSVPTAVSFTPGAGGSTEP